MKRVLTLILALVFIFNLLPNVQLVEANVDQVIAQTSSPVVVYEDSFELGKTFTEGGNSDKPTTADRQNYWHGATPDKLPNNTDLFTQDWQSGSVILSGGVGGAWDGESCISLTNDPNHAAANDRIYLNYNLMNVIKSGKLTLKDNQMYVFSIWVKYAAGTTYTSKIMVKNSQTFTTESGATSNQNPYAENNTNKTTEWTKIEVPFMYHSSKTNILVDLEMQGNSATGTIYFDLLQITELVDATGMSLDVAQQVDVGAQIMLKPTMMPANASTTVTWTSSNPSVASVDANGVVTGVSNGTATITAKAAVKNYDFVNRKYLADKVTYTATCEVTVLGNALGILLNKTEMTLEKGSKGQLTATVNPSDLQSSIVWASADSNVASVNAATGEVTAVAEGTTKITAKAGGYEASCLITVVKVPTGDVEILDGSFELSIDNNISGHVSEKGNVKWNGANLSSNWTTYFERGNINLSVIKDASVAQDGRYCLAFTPVGTGRANLQYKIPASEMRSGHEYIIKVWFKGTAGTDMSSRVQAVYLTSGNATTSGALTEEWTCLEHRFTYRLIPGRDPMTINIGMMNDGTAGTMYVDNVSITHIPREDAPATGIQFTSSEVDMAVDKTKQLTVVAIPENTTDTLIYEWKSSDESIATVDANGKVKALKEGTVTITATAGGFKATCTIYVKDMSPSSLKIEDGSFELSKDNSLSGFISSKGNVKWNGADISRYWHPIVDEGNLNYEIIKDASIAQDGKYCVKITPKGVARGGIQYQIPASMLIEGAEYVVKVWFKGSGENDYKNRIQAVYLKSGNLTTGTTLKDEWVCLEHRFIYKHDSSRDPVLINIGMGETGTTGSIYIDNISIERVLKAESVILDTYELWLERGQTYKLQTTLLPADLDLSAVFKTSDGSVAAVDKQGLITAASVGTAKITVVATGGTSAECVVHVVDKYTPTTSMTMEKSSLNVTPGSNQQLKVFFAPTNASNQNVTWSTSDASVVKVNASGVITALRSGTATITAKSGAFSATCTVTVADDASFPSKTGFLRVNFGRNSSIQLSALLKGSEYTVISQPVNGMVRVNGSQLIYTSYTWLMEDHVFTDQSYGDYAHAEYADSVLIAVKNGDKTATIELKITISPIADLFYDDDGKWITDVNVLFSEEQLKSIRAQITNKNGLYYELLQNLIAQLQLKIGRKPTQYVKPNYAVVSASYDTDSRSNAETATDFMIAYLLTKGVRGYEDLNKQYLDKSIEWLEALLWYPFWGTLGYQNNDLAGGHHLFATAIAYTWLQDELKNRTVDQRIGTDGSSEEAWNNTVKIYKNQPFLEALEMRLWQAGRDMYSRNYTYDCYVMNHLHVRMGGLSAAATALRNQPNLTPEQQEELLRWNAMVLYKDGNAVRFAMPDGTSQEGVPYWEYGAEWVIKAGLNIRTALGIDLFDMTKVYQHSGSYLLYNLLPTDHWERSSSILNVGDSPLHHYNGPGHILRFIASEYGDENAQWLAEQVEDKGINNGGQWLSILVANPNVKAVAPSLDETLHWFKDMDHVIARTDWSGNEDFLSIKSGIPTGKNLYELVLNGTYAGDPDAGHAHPDANHITLFANGEFLLKDDGYADKFTANHNTLLVNGKGQLGEGSDWLKEIAYMEYGAEPFMKVVVSTDVYDYIVGDATEAYAPDLGVYTYERNVLWLKQEQVLLVVDNIIAEDGTHLELRWSTSLKQVFEVAGGYMAVGKNNVMSIYPFTKSAATTYETVVLNADDVTYEGDILRQQYVGSNWQNAIAFSWNDTGLETAEVRYLNAGNNVHKFGVNGKTYAIDVSTNKVTVTKGELKENNPEIMGNSSIAAIEINGQALENFDPAVTEYEIQLSKKISAENLKIFTVARGAQVSVKINLRQITITCVSRDGTSTTTYILRTKSANKIEKMEIVGAVSDITSEDYDLASSYDGVITVGNTGNYWMVQSPQSGKITVTYDLGEFVRIQRIDLALHDSHSRENYYDLLVSLDGETWTTIQEAQSIEPTADISGNAHAFRTIVRNQSLTARYVRVVLRGHTKGSVDNRDKAGIYSGINEIAIYGWKLTAEMRPLTIINASTDVFREGYDLASTYDGIVTLGNAGSYWTVQAPESGKISVIYDFGTLSMIQKIDLAMQNSFGRTNYYDLLISEDGKTWTVIQEMAGVAPTYDISDNAHAFRTILQDQALLARYVKIILRGNVDGLVDNRDTFGVFSGINEITFYGATLSTDSTFNVKPPLTEIVSEEEEEEVDIPTRPRPNTGTDSSNPSETEPADEGDTNWITWLVVAFAVAGVAAVAWFVLYVKKKNQRATLEQDA